MPIASTIESGVSGYSLTLGESMGIVFLLLMTVFCATLSIFWFAKSLDRSRETQDSLRDKS